MTGSSRAPLHYLPPDYLPLAPYTVHVILADGSEESYQFEALWMAANFSIVARAQGVKKVHLFDGRAGTVMVWVPGLFDAVNAYFEAFIEHPNASESMKEMATKLEMTVRGFRAELDHLGGAR